MKPVLIQSKSKFSGSSIRDKIVNEFSLALRAKLRKQIKQITLFGSRARGDNSIHSDYDFLIIVDKKNEAQKNIILDICVNILNKHNVLISFLLYDEAEWKFKQRFPLGLNILKEGIIV